MAPEIVFSTPGRAFEGLKTKSTPLYAKRQLRNIQSTIQLAPLLPYVCPPQGGLTPPSSKGWALPRPPWPCTLPLCREMKAGNERPLGGRPEPALRKQGASIPRQQHSPQITCEFINELIAAMAPEIAFLTLCLGARNSFFDPWTCI